MKLYGGIDLHSNNSVVVLINEKSKEITRKRLPNDLNSILAFLSPYQTEIISLVVSPRIIGIG